MSAANKFYDQRYPRDIKPVRYRYGWSWDNDTRLWHRRVSNLDVLVEEHTGSWTVRDKDKIKAQGTCNSGDQAKRIASIRAGKLSKQAN